MSEIHKSVLAAMHAISKTGIAKLGKNKDQNYNFRGIEAAMNEMSPILVNAGIIVSPSYTDLLVTHGESKSGTKLRFVTLKGSFKFEASDGSFVTGEAYGEGMDSSDKAISKAQSVAYRTALFQQFIVPTMAMDPEDSQEEPEPPKPTITPAKKTMWANAKKAYLRDGDLVKVLSIGNMTAEHQELLMNEVEAESKR